MQSVSHQSNGINPQNEPLTNGTSIGDGSNDKTTDATSDISDLGDVLSRILRVPMPHLDLSQHLSTTDSRLEFVSKGKNDCSILYPRPLPREWPDSLDRLVNELKLLDSHLADTHFSSKPIEWMLQKKLTSLPSCRKCSKPMVIKIEGSDVRWICRTSCIQLYAQIQRPKCFKGFEHLELMRLLWTIYHWSVSSPLDIIKDRLLDTKSLHTIWKRLQRVCNTALYKSYPRSRLSSNPEGSSGPVEPIDLIYVKFNEHKIVCAKHPKDGLIRLGQADKDVVSITENWFSHGAHIRVCQQDLMELKNLRKDLEIQLAPLSQMVLDSNNSFNTNSAFNFLISMLTNCFREFDSRSIPFDVVSNTLAEIEWRESYGKTPVEAFVNIVNHISLYSQSNTHIFMPDESDDVNQIILEQRQEDQEPVEPEEIFIESYYYATVDPIDSEGKVIRKYKPDAGDQPFAPQFLCHICNNHYESFDFALHLVAHIEEERQNQDQQTLDQAGFIECKHCFKPFKSSELKNHKELYQMDLQTTKNGCRICCIKFRDETQYLQHMTKYHVKHETPYRCPKCPTASSFQRDILIHFQEEHSHDYTMMCLICFKSFTLAEPGALNTSRVSRAASELFHNHIESHYILSESSYSCDSCSLSFTERKQLKKHHNRHHNSSETRPDNVKLQPFIVSPPEEIHCLKTRLKTLQEAQIKLLAEGRHHLIELEGDGTPPRAATQLSAPNPVEIVPSNTIINCLSKMKQIDGLLPTDGVIMSPNGLPAQCAECLQYVTVYHYMAAVQCQLCDHITYCPMASENHQATKHPEFYAN